MGKVIKLIAEYNIGETVYLSTDPEQEPRLVTGILIKPNDLIMYELAYCEDTSYHYGFEITKDIDLIKKFNNNNNE